MSASYPIPNAVTEMKSKNMLHPDQIAAIISEMQPSQSNAGSVQLNVPYCKICDIIGKTFYDTTPEDVISILNYNPAGWENLSVVRTAPSYANIFIAFTYNTVPDANTSQDAVPYLKLIAEHVTTLVGK